jgi:hypothetical protein
MKHGKQLVYGRLKLVCSSLFVSSQRCPAGEVKAHAGILSERRRVGSIHSRRNPSLCGVPYEMPHKRGTSPLTQPSNLPQGHHSHLPSHQWVSPSRISAKPPLPLHCRKCSQIDENHARIDSTHRSHERRLVSHSPAKRTNRQQDPTIIEGSSNSSVEMVQHQKGM